MIVLDTNVISEPLKRRADPAVIRWLDAQDPETLYLTAINLAQRDRLLQMTREG